MNCVKDIHFESFDLLLTTSNTLFSSLIVFCQWFCNRSTYGFSHVAIILKGDIFPDNAIIKKHKFDKKKLYLLECVIKTFNEGPDISQNYLDGVQIREFDIVFNNYIINNETIRLGISKPTLETKNKIKNYFDNNVNKINFFNIVTDIYGKKYNYNLIDEAYIPFHNFILMRIIKWIKDIVINFFYKKYKNQETYVCSSLIVQILKKINLLNKNININHFLPEDFIVPKYDNQELLYQVPIDIK
jgi:hypothetical protein